MRSDATAAGDSSWGVMGWVGIFWSPTAPTVAGGWSNGGQCRAELTSFLRRLGELARQQWLRNGQGAGPRFDRRDTCEQLPGERCVGECGRSLLRWIHPAEPYKPAIHMVCYE